MLKKGPSDRVAQRAFDFSIASTLVLLTTLSQLTRSQEDICTHSG
jgi:hypothetical protein